MHTYYYLLTTKWLLSLRSLTLIFFVMHLNCATLTQKRSTDSFQKIGKMFCSSEKFYYLCPAIVANN